MLAQVMRLGIADFYQSPFWGGVGRCAACSDVRRWAQSAANPGDAAASFRQIRDPMARIADGVRDVAGTHSAHARLKRRLSRAHSLLAARHSRPPEDAQYPDVEIAAPFRQLGRIYQAILALGGLDRSMDAPFGRSSKPSELRSKPFANSSGSSRTKLRFQSTGERSAAAVAAHAHNMSA